MSVQPRSQKQAAPPSKGSLSKVIKDRNGTSYRLFIAIRGDRHCLRLYTGQTCIGEARCSWQADGSMVLDDIAIANEANPALTPLERLQQWFLGAEFEPVNYRQQGLGTTLLHSVINHGRKLGASSLRGEVFQADVENNPGLLEWYQRHGFTQAAPRPEQVDVLANITLELRSRPSSEDSRNPARTADFIA